MLTGGRERLSLRAMTASFSIRRACERTLGEGWRAPFGSPPARLRTTIRAGKRILLG
jgi:hypothetical protein